MSIVRDEPLAIIGLGCRFPGGADSPEAFWRLLMTGTDAISTVPADRWDVRRFYDADPTAPGKTYVREGGFLRQPLETFDAAFFGISPREAATLDPQQRLLLEVVWEAFEDAGVDLTALRGSRTGVFIGGFCLDSMIQTLGVQSRDAIYEQTATSSSLALLANRLSYVFDLRGPSFAVDTACSSSLTSLHLACQAVTGGHCEVAVAGGVNFMLRPEYFIAASKGGFLSPDARCKAFDARANGYARGEGAGAVVVKPLSRAIAANDPIRAIVRGTGLNQDGRSQGITAPNSDSQRVLLREVCERAGVEPWRIRYVEAHGTGTAVGDPVEMNALGAELSRGRPAGDTCLVGSVKTNIGHLEAAAGVAGIIKAALCLDHREVPPNLHFQTPNPSIDFERLGLRVPVERARLESADGPIFATVNSFGYGGANANVVLEEPPRRPAPSEDTRPAESLERAVVVPLSARSEGALREHARRIAAFLEANPETRVEDVGHTLALRRAHHAHRGAVAARSIADLVAGLTALATGGEGPAIATGHAPADRPRRLAFVYTGMGSQWWGMGRELFQTEPVFRAALEDCERAARAAGAPSLLDAYGWTDGEPGYGGAPGSPMSRPADAQPAGLALQIALTKLLASKGVTPEAVMGHSAGEIAAAWAAGVLSLEDAFVLTHNRSRVLEYVDRSGTMLAVGAPESALADLLQELAADVDVAARNSPTSLVLAGQRVKLEAIAGIFAARGVFNRFLKVEVAYHSRQLDTLRRTFLDGVAGVTVREPSLPLYSTVTGARWQPRFADSADGAEAPVVHFWNNMRKSVEFCAAIRALADDGHDTFLEVGPSPALALAILESLAEKSVKPQVLSTLTRGANEPASLLNAVARVHVEGGAVDWRATFGRGALVRLPLYPWQREVHWFETDAGRFDRCGSTEHPLLQAKRVEPEPTWSSSVGATATPYVLDHRVADRVLVPGALFAEIALAAARATGRPLRVEGLAFEKVLVGPSASLRIACSSDGQLTVHSAVPEAEGRFLLHARATLGTAPLHAVPPVSRGALEASCPDTMTADDLYRALEARGLGYGPRFQTVRSLRVGPSKVLARLACHDDDAATAAQHHIHPALLDGGFQTLVAAQGGGTGQAVMVPVKIRELRVHAPAGASAWVFGRVRAASEWALLGDLVLFDDDGRVLCEVLGLECRSLTGRASLNADGRLYHDAWVPSPRALSRPAPAKGRWLVLADRRGAAEGMIASLREAGREVVVEPARREPTLRADLDHLIAKAGPLEGALFAWPADAPDEDDADARTGQGLAVDLLHLAQSLAATKEITPPRLVVVTAGLFDPAGASTTTTWPSAAATWGLVRVLGHELSALRPLAIDLCPRDPRAEGAAAVAEIFAAPEDGEIALRDGCRYVHRVARGHGADAAPRRASTPDVAFVLDALGPGQIDSLAYVESRRRAPDRGEVEIAVRVTPLNFKDVMKVMGMLDERYLASTFFGTHLGVECAGIVTRVGADVTGFAIGDEVVSPDGNGCFRSFNTVPTRYLVKKPRGLSWAESVCFINYLTAWYALEEHARLERGERVLIHSAASGVGLAAVHLAQKQGALVFATAGSEERRAHLRKLGVVHVFDSRSLAFADGIREVTDGCGVDVVLNSLSGDALTRSLESLAKYGRFIEIGKRDILAGRRISMDVLARQATLTAIDVDCLMAERPALFQRLIAKVWTLLDNGELPPLFTEVFAPGQTIEAFQRMARAEHLGKIVIDYEAGPASVRRGFFREAAIRGDATYLVTGGLGGFGLATAGRLADKGARNLVLVGRSGAASPEARAALAALADRGVTVQARCVDVSERGEIDALFAEMRSRLPPLRGVFHAAMVLDDGMIGEQTAARFARVMAPKARGALHLHDATRAMELDFFVLFSSVSSVLGSPGQANYVAANAFLDALAWHRRALGLAAVSVNWGAIGDVGVLTRTEGTREHLARQGAGAMSSADALLRLDELLDAGAVQTIVADINWSRLASGGLFKAATSRLAQLLQADGGDAESLAQRLHALPEEERIKLVSELVCGAVTAVLRMDAAQVDPALTLDNLGVGSLMSVDIANRITRATSIEVTPVMLMRGQTIAELSAEIARLVKPAPGADGTNAPTPEADMVDGMSEQELEAVLAEMLEP